MHTTKIDETVFNHNGDFSGEIRISNNQGTIEVPFSHLRYLVCEYVRAEKIRALEQASDSELLGF